jgi:tetratricopeptide (TPR) repeat protein
MLEARVIRRRAILASAACAVALGAAAWLVLGPLWAIAGLAAGAFGAILAFAVGMTYITPTPETLLAKGRPEDALMVVQRLEGQRRLMAGKWPSMFAGELARDLLAKSDALHALHQDNRALRTADEAVAIYQTLAADSPARYAHNLARAISIQSHRMASVGLLAEAITASQTSIRLFRELALTRPEKYRPLAAQALTCMAEWLADIDNNAQALAAAQEATSTYWSTPVAAGLPAHAARAALLEGRLLCQQARYHEAAAPLARGWNLATRLEELDALAVATPALRTTYRALAADFATVWRAETGSDVPEWLSS